MQILNNECVAGCCSSHKPHCVIYQLKTNDRSFSSSIWYNRYTLAPLLQVRQQHGCTREWISCSWSWPVCLWPVGGTQMGQEEKQAQDELREVESRFALLLRQKHHPQDVRQALRLPLCVWLEKPAGIHSRRAAHHVRREARHGWVNFGRWK